MVNIETRNFTYFGILDQQLLASTYAGLEFLPTRRYASAVFATASVCLSVCPSVCHTPVSPRYCA